MRSRAAIDGDTGMATAQTAGIHIALVAPTDYSGFPTGGTASLVREIASALRDRHGYRVSRIGLRSSQGGHAERTEDEGDRILVAGVNTRGLLPVRVGYLYGLRRSQHRLRKLAPGVAYAHNAESALGIDGVWPHVPVVLHLHGLDNPLGLSRFPVFRSQPFVRLYEHLVIRRALRIASRVLINVDKMQFEEFKARYSALLQAPPTRVTGMVTPGRFDPTDRLSVRHKLGIREDAVVIIFVGRVEPPKQVDLLIQAWALVRQGRPSLKLLIVGDGSHMPELRSLARQLGFGQDVLFLGRQESSAVAKYLCAADVFASCSARESISMAMLEALAAGLPCVLGPVAGAWEAVGPEDVGVVVDEFTPTAFADAIRRTVERAPSMRERCRVRAEAYSVENVSRQIANTLEESAMEASLRGVG